MKKSSPDTGVLFQNVSKLEKVDSLFFTDVLVGGKVLFRPLLDNGSMACTINEEAEQRIKNYDLACEPTETQTDILLIGCGGTHVKPKCVCQLEIEMYGHRVSVPTLGLPGQRDQMIILRQLKKTSSYWRVLNKPESSGEGDIELFLNMLSDLQHWKGTDMPYIVGTARLERAVPLLPQHEHLVWARLPFTAPVSEGSTIMIEPFKSQAPRKNVIVGRVVASMTADRWNQSRS